MFHQASSSNILPNHLERNYAICTTFSHQRHRHIVAGLNLSYRQVIIKTNQPVTNQPGGSLNSIVTPHPQWRLYYSSNTATHFILRITKFIDQLCSPPAVSGPFGWMLTTPTRRPVPLLADLTYMPKISSSACNICSSSSVASIDCNNYYDVPRRRHLQLRTKRLWWLLFNWSPHARATTTIHWLSGGIVDIIGGTLSAIA